MAAQISPIAREELLSARAIREAIRNAAGGFAPDHVARFLRERLLDTPEEEAAEIVAMLGELASAARARLREAAIEPSESALPLKLSKRERERAANLSMLLAAQSSAATVAIDDKLAVELGDEAVAWARLARDHAQQSTAWSSLATAHSYAGRNEECVQACAADLAAARASGSTLCIAESLLRYVATLHGFLLFEEARPMLEEVQTLLSGDIPEESRAWLYATCYMHEGLALIAANEYPEGMRRLREALRWTDGAALPMTRSIVLTQLGMHYLELAEYRQSILCQNEVIQLSQELGSTVVRAWGFVRLAEAHRALKEPALAMELLTEAESCAPERLLALRLSIASRRARLLIEQGNLDAAAELSRWIIANASGGMRYVLTALALIALGDIETARGRLDSAEEQYRTAAELGDRHLPDRSWHPKGLHAEALHRLGRDDEALTVLDAFTNATNVPPEQEARALRVRAAIAETRGELRTALEYEREAFAIERELLERQGEQTLRNARIMAETERLEREAELERERRRRLERDLADAVVALGDRERLVANVEERLRMALNQSGAQTERTITDALREAVVSLRAGSRTQETPLHYLAGVEEDFYARLRLRYPGLTRKQERLCGLLRAGLSSKEIATLLDVGPDGLKAQRKRLRKRLDLDQEASLEKMMAEI